ncbi:MAG: AmmeMemoRadiSam system protein B [Planctomycetota bacterium]
MDRPARFAGSWYPGDPARLEAEIAAAEGPPARRASARALVLPHAGYRFSLRIGAPAVARVEVPPLVAVLCPNHTVPPPIVAAWPDGAWETPLGRVSIDAEVTQALARGYPELRTDPDAALRAHLREHAIELVLPLLQRRRADLRLVAVVVAEPRLERLQALGRALAAALAGREALIVASSDMSHFLDAEEARRRDERALERLRAFDPVGLLQRCEDEDISMCGVRPTVVALEAARALGASAVEVVAYGHSGEVTGDDERVVGYAAAIVR